MRIQTKFLSVGRLGWRLVCHNMECFGWELYDAEKVNTTTTTTTYEGEIDGDTIHITPHTSTSTERRVDMTFCRDLDAYKNLFIVRFFEIFYNIVFVIRRILSHIVPSLFLIVMISWSFFSNFWQNENPELFETIVKIWLAWPISFLLENIFPLIAKIFLRKKY